MHDRLLATRKGVTRYNYDTGCYVCLIEVLSKTNSYAFARLYKLSHIKLYTLHWCGTLGAVRLMRLRTDSKCGRVRMVILREVCMGPYLLFVDRIIFKYVKSL